MYAFRIRTSYEEFSKNTDFPNLLNSCDRYCIYQHQPEHNEENIHIHGLLVNPMYIPKGYTTAQPETPEHMRRMYFAKYYTNQYSLKKCDDEEKYITYMSKGQYNPSVWVDNATKQYKYIPYFDELKSKWVDHTKVNLKLIDGKMVRELGKNKLSKREIIDIMMADYRDYMPMEDVIKLIRKTLIKNNEVLGLYKVMDYYDALLMYGNKAEFTALIISKINSRGRV